jgi:TolB protein
MNPDGSAKTIVSPPPAVFTHADANAAWSPDGSTIAFESDRSGHRQVWAMKANGTSLVNITHCGSGDDNAPAWSPDGTHLAYASDRGGKLDIWTMDLNGPGLTNITTSLAGYACGNPAWSAIELIPSSAQP